MTAWQRGLRNAILTTPSGLVVVQYLLERLDVVGVLVDRGAERAAASEPRPLWERLHQAALRDGVRGVARRVAGRLIPALGNDPLAWARRAETRHLEALDEAFFGYPQFAQDHHLRQFVAWDDVRAAQNVPVIEVENINDERAAEALRAWSPDLAIIAGGRIVKPHILAIPRLGVLNKHSSILPRHRGLAAEYWCLYHEDFASLGVTVHYVQPGLDDGPVVVQRKMAFRKGDTPGTLRFKSNLVGRAALVDAVRLIAATGTRGTPQDEALATRNVRPTAASDRILYGKLRRLWAQHGV